MRILKIWHKRENKIVLFTLVISYSCTSNSHKKLLKCVVNFYQDVHSFCKMSIGIRKTLCDKILCILKIEHKRKNKKCLIHSCNKLLVHKVIVIRSCYWHVWWISITIFIHSLRSGLLFTKLLTVILCTILSHNTTKTRQKSLKHSFNKLLLHK